MYHRLSTNVGRRLPLGCGRVSGMGCTAVATLSPASCEHRLAWRHRGACELRLSKRRAGPDSWAHKARERTRERELGWRRARQLPPGRQAHQATALTYPATTSSVLPTLPARRPALGLSRRWRRLEKGVQHERRGRTGITPLPAPSGDREVAACVGWAGALRPDEGRGTVQAGAGRAGRAIRRRKDVRTSGGGNRWGSWVHHHHGCGVREGRLGRSWYRVWLRGPGVGTMRAWAARAGRVVSLAPRTSRRYVPLTRTWAGRDATPTAHDGVPEAQRVSPHAAPRRWNVPLATRIRRHRARPPSRHYPTPPLARQVLPRSTTIQQSGVQPIDAGTIKL